MDFRHPKAPRRGLGLLAVLALYPAGVVTSPHIVHAECLTTICSGDPCTISGTHHLDDLCTLDFGSKSVTIGPNTTIDSVLSEFGTFTIKTGALTVQGLVEAPGGCVDLQVTGAFRSESVTVSGTSHHGRVFANDGGEVDITAGSITIANQSRVRANGGGFIDLCVGSRAPSTECIPSTASISITSKPQDGNGAVTAMGDFGSLTIIGGSLTIGPDVAIEADNGSGDAGSIGLTARGSMLLDAGSIVRANGSGSGYGGDIQLDVAGQNTATLKGTVRAVGGNGMDAADGSVTVGPDCDIVLSGTIDTKGPPDDGFNELAYRNTLNVSGGAVMGGADGHNLITCRSANGSSCVNPPSGGTFNPPAVTVFDTTLGPCSGCGDGELDPGELCDDGNITPCDGCGTTCQGNTCTDGNACTTSDHCSGPTCLGTPLTCNDSNACTTDSCNPATGCVFTNNTLPCTSDSNACTTDVCSGGVCTHPSITCNDSNVCTTDTCNAATGCVFTNNTAPCASDGNACTTDVCSGGVCTHPSISCNDSNVCTTDTCNAATGCVFTNNTAPCASDGNACTTDVCSGGVCTHPSISCNDSNVCTTDTCNAATGCVFTNNTAPCASDGNACTTDVCSGGVCTHSSITCNDSNVCTTDSCSPASGCVFSHNTLSCTDGDPCTGVDVCHNGTCFGFTVTSCDDGNPCTVDTCSPSPGCTHTLVGCGFDLAMQLHSPFPAADNWFGASMTPVGSGLIVGAPRDNAFGPAGAGATYRFNGSTGAFELIFGLAAPVAGDEWGHALAALDSVRAVIGAPYRDQGASDAGVARVLDVTSGSSSELVNPSPMPQEAFGFAVAAYGNNIVAGSPYDTAAGTNVGAVHLFDGSSLALLRTLTPPPGAGGEFGYAVYDLSGNVLAGSPLEEDEKGAVYLYNGSSGALMRRFSAPAPIADDRLGHSVGALGPDVLAGAPHASGTGAVFLFDPTNGSVKQTFVSPSGAQNQNFGSAVATLESVVLIGAPSGSGPGAAYLFDPVTGAVMDSFESPAPMSGDLAGFAVAARGHDVMVGAPAADASGGAVYVYVKRCGNGVVDSGEQCDDGNTKDRDCCSSTCQYEPAESDCPTGNLCTLGTCNGAGTCTAGACQIGLRCGAICGADFFCQMVNGSCTCQ